MQSQGSTPICGAQCCDAQRSAYDDFCEQLDRLERSIPRHIDPESAAADDWYRNLPLDPYAATDTAEFFAVSGEVFFFDPAALQQAFPAWFSLLCQFFRQDPLTKEILQRNPSAKAPE